MAKEKKKKKARLSTILISEVIIVIVLYIGARFYDTLGKIQHENSEDLNIKQNENIVTSGYRNIVIFSVDSRQNSLKSGTNSDTIMIASINNKTKDVKLASVYRDTYVDIPEDGYDKINAAYCNG